MKVSTFPYNLPEKNAPVYLEPLGCIHVGNINFAKDKFEERVKAIADDPNRYWIGMGDYVDGITVAPGGITDFRFNWKHLDLEYKLPQEQYEYIYQTVKPIANKCLGLLEGNHDWKLIQKHGFDYLGAPSIGLAARLGTPLFMKTAFVKLRCVFKGKVIRDFTIFTGHGRYGGEQVGGNVNRLKQIARYILADVYLMGHTHNIFTTKATRLATDGKHIIRQRVLFGATGSFLEGYVEDHDSYIEEAIREPGRVGTITIEFNPYDGKIMGHD